MGAQAKRKAISKAGSEIPPRKRGRPPAFPAEWLSILQGLYPDIRSGHGLLNVAYRQDAIRLLKDHPECAWLCDYAAIQVGKGPRTQWSLLAELGRLLQTHTPASVLKLAKVVCQQRPGVKDGVARLRRLRTGERLAMPTSLSTSSPMPWISTGSNIRTCRGRRSAWPWLNSKRSSRMPSGGSRWAPAGRDVGRRRAKICDASRNFRGTRSRRDGIGLSRSTPSGATKSMVLTDDPRHVGCPE
jgi:hypothetical protein